MANTNALRPTHNTHSAKRAKAIRTKPSHRLYVTSTDTPTAAIRTFLGIVFVISGLNGFFSFLPEFEVTSQGITFLDTLSHSYFWPMLKTAELMIGSALLFNVYAQFAIFILAPITMGILWFHLFLSPPGAWFAWAIFLAEVTLTVTFRNQIKQVFFPRHSSDRGKVIHDDPR